MSNYDVVSICNALVDILVTAEEHDIKELELTKGQMHLVDGQRQAAVLKHVGNKEQTVELGGSSLNALRSLASMGARTSFAGMVGKDEFGRMISERMESLGIDAELKEVSEETGSCVVLITPDGERTMNTNLGSSRLYGPDLVPEEKIKSSKIFHFCGYQWDTDDQKTAINKAIEIAKKNNTLVSFDVADPFVVSSHQKDLVDIIDKHADIVFANESEAGALYGLSTEETAAKIAATGAIAVIKLGAKGAMIQKGEQTFKIDPVATTVIDTTAAGDMFAAGFLYGFSQEKPLETCGKTAATLASDVISRIGAKVSKEALEKAKSL